MAAPTVNAAPLRDAILSELRQRRETPEERFARATTEAGSDRYSMFQLAECYRDGKGTPVDHAKAFELWSQLEKVWGNNNEGLPCDLSVELGLCYRDGLGVAPDEKKAYAYFQTAVDADGDPHACYYLAELQFKAKEYTAAYNNLCACSDAHLGGVVSIPNALLLRARCEGEGLGTEANLDEALHWVKEAKEYATSKKTRNACRAYKMFLKARRAAKAKDEGGVEDDSNESD